MGDAAGKERKILNTGTFKVFPFSPINEGGCSLEEKRNTVVAFLSGGFL